MKRLQVITALTLMAVSTAMGQQELPQELPGGEAGADSTATPAYMRPVETGPDAPTQSFGNRDDLFRRQIENTIATPSVFAPTMPLDLHSGSTVVTAPGMVMFPLWQGGSLTASGSSNSMPGMMGIEQGNLTFTQQFGQFTLTAYASASHYGYFRGLQTAYGFGGSLSYRINDRWAVTVFGSYSTPLHPLTAGMAGYMSAPNFGGYASYEINEHWGINVGAQTTRSLVTNRWEAQPIVEPYYKINGRAAIKVDVGGILYNILQNASESRNGYRANPTIGPPVGGPPPVAPHPGR